MAEATRRIIISESGTSIEDIEGLRRNLLAFRWRSIPGLPADLVGLLEGIRYVLLGRAETMFSHPWKQRPGEPISESAELAALREMADAWEAMEAAPWGCGDPGAHDEARQRHAAAAKAVRALRKGAGGG